MCNLAFAIPSRAGHRAARRSTAFTLIELLVVVAIIAVLIAILLPSLSRAREKARQVACSANLHGYGIAIQAYISEYNKALTSLVNPFGGSTPCAMWVYDTHADQVSLEALAPYMGGVNGLNRVTNPEASLQQSSITITKVWICPSQAIYTTSPDVPNWHWFSLNYCYFAGFDLAPLNGMATTPNDLFGHVSQPNKILMEDDFFRWANPPGGGTRWDINHGLGGSTAQHLSGPFVSGPPQYAGNNVLYSDNSVRFKQAGEYASPAQLDSNNSSGAHVNGGGGDQTFY